MQMPSLVLTAAPSVEPLSVSEARQHLRVDTTADDNLISALIIAARQAAETKTRRALLPQTWKLSLPAFPVVDIGLPQNQCTYARPQAARIKLPRPPCITVASVTYVDTAGATQTLAASAYSVGQDGMMTTLHPVYGTQWPSTRDDDNAVNITFTAGYASPKDVPEPIKAWMKIMIGSLYENREIVLHGQTASASLMPRGFADGLLDPYIVPAVA